MKTAQESHHALHPDAAYIAPFATFVAFLIFDRFLPFTAPTVYGLRFAVVLAVLVWLSRHVIPFQAVSFTGSLIVGVAAFAIWVGPDLVWPAYRHSWPFNNLLVGAPRSSLAPALKTSAAFIMFRVLGSVVNVPVAEELFWRGWLMRWLISKDFEKVPRGSYTPQSFWTVAVLFASEHGSYWEVGFITGILYNWWMVRTRSLGDCIIAHAVTNACLAIYVLKWDQWSYWL